MAKDRNTFAKRQRETEKRRKAAEKLERRKQRTSGQGVKVEESGPEFSELEIKVFDHFRKYLMTPGDMLCFSAQEIESMGDGLEDLVKRQLLVPENTHGGYSLTRIGFFAMRANTTAE